MSTSNTKTGVCDVHRWALNDTKEREVKYCRHCGAWICDECRPNTALRAKAMAKRALSRI